VRLLEQSADTITVHWRYFPDAAHLEWDGVVEEYFRFTPDMKVIRSIQKATVRIDDWENQTGKIVQVILLLKNGVKRLSQETIKSRPKEKLPARGNPNESSENQTLALWFSFDGKAPGDSPYASENISGKSYLIHGSKALWKKGVSGSALQFDGYYTGISVPGPLAEDLSEEISVQGWFALAAYPFDRAPLIQQSEWGKKGFYLGIDQNGYPGFHVGDGDRRHSLIDSNRIELFKWYHIAGVFNRKAGEISLFLNGKKAGAAKNIKEPMALSDTPLMLGLNREKMPVINGRIRRGKWPSLFGIDGLIDEVKIYNSALSIDEIAIHYKKNKPADSRIKDRKIVSRKLPVNPHYKSAPSFGAEYKTLHYYETWDNLWRVGDKADIVIHFDLLPVNIVFWRGTSYGPYFVSENGKWIGDQSNEDYREDAHPGEAEGCLEHMSDKQCRHSHVRIIENHDARVLIHWRYGLVDSRYLFSPRNDGWGSWSDEYWTIYPDGVAIRHLARGKVFGDGWVETMFLSEPGTRPEDNTELQALTLVNVKGEIERLSWETGTPETKLEEPIISMVNTKSDYRMFNIFPTGSGVEVFGGHSRRSHFHWWNHWPVSQITSDGRGARAADRLAHSSLVWGAPSGNFLMYGISNKSPERLLPLANSWNSAPLVSDKKGFDEIRYIQEERAYQLKAPNKSVSFTIEASDKSPLLNPAFVLKGWNGKSAGIKVNGVDLKPGKKCRTGYHFTAEGLNLIIWFELTATSKTRFEFTKND
jgi:hypothetical protein